AIDFRPATGQLFGLGFAGTTGQIYTINTATAEATAVGSTSLTLNATDIAFGFDFNPATDRIRITTNNQENLRVNPDTGALVLSDSSITTGDIAGIAYDRNFLGATSTTLFGYNFQNDNLVTVGSVNGTPNSPNT